MSDDVALVHRSGVLLKCMGDARARIGERCSNGPVSSILVYGPPRVFAIWRRDSARGQRVTAREAWGPERASVGAACANSKRGKKRGGELTLVHICVRVCGCAGVCVCVAAGTKRKRRHGTRAEVCLTLHFIPVISPPPAQSISLFGREIPEARDSPLQVITDAHVRKRIEVL